MERSIRLHAVEFMCILTWKNGLSDGGYVIVLHIELEAIV